MRLLPFQSLGIGNQKPIKIKLFRLINLNSINTEIFQHQKENVLLEIRIKAEFVFFFFFVKYAGFLIFRNTFFKEIGFSL